jgi:hypothetical protein
MIILCTNFKDKGPRLRSEVVRWNADIHNLQLKLAKHVIYVYGLKFVGEVSYIAFGRTCTVQIMNLYLLFFNTMAGAQLRSEQRELPFVPSIQF